MYKSSLTRTSVVFVAMLAISGCTIQRANPAATPSPAQTPSAKATPTTSPVLQPTPPPQPTPQPNPAVWDTEQLWNNRSVMVNQTITIADTVTHESRCPDVVGVRDEQCTTVVWLGETGRHPFPVYQNGEWTQCQGKPTECNGWRKNETYQVIATLRQKQLNSGKLLDSYYLDVVVISRR